MEVDVTRQFGRKTIQVSFRSQSQHVRLKGPSGAGKTTVLRILAGLEPLARGKILFRGTTWLDSEKGQFVPAWKRRVGWVPQDALCFPHLSVRENLAFSGKPSAEETEAMAKSLEILPLLNRRVKHLSGGERHRVSLGRALLSKPELLLLDEPFSSLDKPLRKILTEFVATFCQARGLPLILVSHDDETFPGEIVSL